VGGKGHFHFQDWRPSNELVNHEKEFPFVLTTGRKLEQYNCGTMTRRTNNSMILAEDTLVVNPADAASKGVSTGDIVCLFSARGKVDLKIEVSDEVKPGILYTTFHFPEHLVNNVTSDEHCSETLCPEYKVSAVDFRKARNLGGRKVGSAELA
jgi:formate dehydrogenase major subunit